MTVNGYDVDLKIGGLAESIDPSLFSFILKDSIYKLYNRGVLELNDATGLFQEALLTREGTKVDIEYSLQDTPTTLKSSLLVDHDVSPESNSPGSVGGAVEIPLVSSYSASQSPSSIAHTGRISDIIKKIISPDLEVDVDGTGNQGTWYQTQDNATFIVEILKPFAYSRDSSSTPFYSYITSDGKFHFKNLGNLEAVRPDLILEYTQNSSKNVSITSLNRWTDPSSLHRELYNREIYKIDPDTGDIILLRDNLSDCGAQQNAVIPVVHGGAITSIVNNHFLGYLEDESYSGRVIDSKRKGLFIEHLAIVLPLTLSLHSGKNVSLEFLGVTIEGTPISHLFSADYIVETCEHVWDGANKIGFTKLVVGRRTVTLPSGYKVKERMLK